LFGPAVWKLLTDSRTPSVVPLRDLRVPSPAWALHVAARPHRAEAGGMNDFEWLPAICVVLVSEGDYSVSSVAFSAGWLFARNENGTVAFPSSQVVKVTLG